MKTGKIFKAVSLVICALSGIFLVFGLPFITDYINKWGIVVIALVCAGLFSIFIMWGLSLSDVPTTSDTINHKTNKV
jgi:hypothetical protein